MHLHDNGKLQTMENFVVSARKYRPKGFEEVVGQDSITTTLQNAIKENHLAQALLFCGPRGVGKTTCARIVAKLINEVDGEDNENSMNIFELDAASNNSVEHIRNLTDQVRYPPQFGKFKVYIIDEVHMLSNQAFNAFLKTLEEPPSYAIFILATTEKHKVIPTILSRCQIFDFNRISISEIMGHLQLIAEKEGINAEAEALHLIAQKSDGALRDALSLFDLITTFSSDNSITYQSTIQNLHILDYDYYFKITDFLLSQDISSGLLLFDEILKKGFEGHNFISGLELHFRNLMVCKDKATHELLEEAENVKSKYLKQADEVSMSFLLSAMNICAQCDMQYKTSKNARLLVELALMKIAHIPSVIDLSSLPADDKKKTEVLAEPSEQYTEKKKVEVIKATKEPEITQTPTTPTTLATPTTPQSPEKSAETTVPAIDEAPDLATDTKPNPIPVKNLSNGSEDTLSSPLKKTGKMPSVNQLMDMVEKPVKEKIDQEKLEISPERKQAFGKNKLDSAWNEFKKERENKPQELNVLSQPYSISEDEKSITIELSNSVQLDILSGIRSDLMIHLKSRLENDTIQVEGLVNQQESKELLYTNQEKLKYLAGKNPLIKTLQEKLGLDPDF